MARHDAQMKPVNCVANSESKRERERERELYCDVHTHTHTHTHRVRENIVEILSGLVASDKSASWSY